MDICGVVSTVVAVATFVVVVAWRRTETGAVVWHIQSELRRSGAVAESFTVRLINTSRSSAFNVSVDVDGCEVRPLEPNSVVNASGVFTAVLVVPHGLQVSRMRVSWCERSMWRNRLRSRASTLAFNCA